MEVVRITDKKQKTLQMVQTWSLAVIAVFLVVGTVQLGSISKSLAGGSAGTVAAPSAPAAAAPSAPTAAAGGGINIANLIADDDPVKGDPDAPVTIVEWSDFECPFCARFYSNTLKTGLEPLVEDGTIKIVYKHFPLSFHPNAASSAQASECAREQGKFWEMHDLIFENQRGLSASAYRGWAEQLGLDMDEYDDCYNSNKHQSQISADQQAGAGAGVRGTPGFVVGPSDGEGSVISGAQPTAVFLQAIEAAQN